MRGYIGNSPSALPINAADLTGTLSNALFPTGAIVQTAYAEYTNTTGFTASIPNDNTIPQISEGTELLTVTITPRSTTNRIRVRFQGNYGASSAGAQVTVALFRDAVADALAATKEDAENTAGWTGHVGLDFEHVPGTVSLVTYRIRVGTHTGTIWFNTNGAGTRNFGGVQRATLIVDEIKA